MLHRIYYTAVHWGIHNDTQLYTINPNFVNHQKHKKERRRCIKKKVEISCKEERLSSKEQTKEAEDEFQDEKVNFKGLIKFTLMMSTIH